LSKKTIIWADSDRLGSQNLEQLAFSYCNDALCTTLSIRYPPETIAHAAVYAACEASGESLTSLHGTQWWSVRKLRQDQLKGTV
jgi:hypothetical protein